MTAEVGGVGGSVGSVFYPTVARRVVKKKVSFAAIPPRDADGCVTLEILPLDQGIAFEKIDFVPKLH